MCILSNLKVFVKSFFQYCGKDRWEKAEVEGVGMGETLFQLVKTTSLTISASLRE